MNSRNNTTAGAQALPARRREPITLDIEASCLDKMSLAELKALFGALRTILDVGCGVSGQPRFWKDDINRNGAGDLVECLNEGLGDAMDAVLKAARNAAPKNAREAEQRAWCILQARSYFEDELSEIAVDAVQALRDVEVAKFNEEFVARTGKAVPS